MPQPLLKGVSPEGRWPRATEPLVEGANRDLPAQFPGRCHCTHLLVCSLASLVLRPPSEATVFGQLCLKASSASHTYPVPSGATEHKAKSIFYVSDFQIPEGAQVCSFSGEKNPQFFRMVSTQTHIHTHTHTSSWLSPATHFSLTMFLIECRHRDRIPSQQPEKIVLILGYQPNHHFLWGAFLELLNLG